MHMPLPASFWAKIDKAGPIPVARPDLGNCWVWTSWLSQGYGRTYVNGRKNVLVHRAVYEELVGPFPVGLEPDHLCMNRACCNPAHIEPVTRSVNVKRGHAGEWLAAKQKAKTHCPQGHPYSPDNTYVHPKNGQRHCRQCMQARAKLIESNRPDRSAYFRAYQAKRRHPPT